MRLIIVSLCLSFYLTCPVEAQDMEIIETTDGQIFRGKMIREVKLGVLFRSAKGEVILIKYEDIKDITLSSVDESSDFPEIEEEPEVLPARPAVDPEVIDEVPLAVEPSEIPPVTPQKGPDENLRRMGRLFQGLGWSVVGVSCAMLVAGFSELMSRAIIEGFGGEEVELSNRSKGFFLLGGTLLPGGLVLYFLGRVQKQRYKRQELNLQLETGFSFDVVVGPEYSGFQLRGNF